MKYVAFDTDAIYAVADSPQAAVAKAREEVRDREAQFDTAPVSDILAAQIERDGWDAGRQWFDINDDGYVIERTRAQ